MALTLRGLHSVVYRLVEALKQCSLKAMQPKEGQNITAVHHKQHHKPWPWAYFTLYGQTKQKSSYWSFTFSGCNLQTSPCLALCYLQILYKGTSRNKLTDFNPGPQSKNRIKSKVKALIHQITPPPASSQQSPRRVFLNDQVRWSWCAKETQRSSPQRSGLL